MAIILLEAPVAAISGKLGGLAFRSHKGRTHLIRKSCPASGAGRATLRQRRALAYGANQWRMLSPTDKQLWYAGLEMFKASLGHEFARRYPSALQLFLTINLRWWEHGQTSIFPPATTPRCGVIPGANFYNVPTGRDHMRYNYSLDGLLDGHMQFNYISGPTSKTAQNPRAWNWFSWVDMGPNNTFGYSYFPTGMGYFWPAGMRLRCMAVRQPFGGLPSKPCVQMWTFV